MILDTNALSALADGEPRAVEQIAKAQLVAIPVIVLGEFRFGIMLSRHRREYEEWLQETLAVATLLLIDEETTRYYAELRVELRDRGTPLPANDVWIAAVCRQHSLPILSRDRHFDSVTELRRVAW